MAREANRDDTEAPLREEEALLHEEEAGTWLFACCRLIVGPPSLTTRVQAAKKKRAAGGTAKTAKSRPTKKARKVGAMPVVCMRGSGSLWGSPC